MVWNPRDVAMHAAQYVASHLAPLSVTFGQLPDGNFGFQAITDADGDFLHYDYIVANGWWYWRISPVRELPSFQPEIRPAIPTRGDGADVAAFIAWQLSEAALPVLVPDRLAGQPVTDANRLDHLNAELAREKDPIAAKTWWEAGTSLLVGLASRRLPSTDASAADAEKYLSWLRLSRTN